MTNAPSDAGNYPFSVGNYQRGQLVTGCLGGLDCTPYVNQPGGLGFAAKLGRHADGSNFMMVDGHVKWFRGAAVSGGSNAQRQIAARIRAWRQAPATASSR